MLEKASQACAGTGELNPQASSVQVVVETPKREGQGDYATTLAMSLASSEGRAPSDIAKTLIRNLDDYEGVIEKTEVAGPGFVNFTIKPGWWRQQIPLIIAEDRQFGRSVRGHGQRVQIEFVSANPTGPLHVGHGRWAAVGNAMANLLRAVGYEVQTEYYINDAGRQVKLLGHSVYARYQQLLGYHYPDPDDGYRGAYITTLAERMKTRVGKAYDQRPVDECLGIFTKHAVDEMLAAIKDDLAVFGIRFDSWFRETLLFERGAVPKVLQELERKDYLYHRDGALWFRSTVFGDDKDRVIRKEDGEYTYLASDVAYHQNKLERGLNRLINIWGADHHGYVSRIEAVIQALGYPKELLSIKVGQLVTLTRAGQPIAMSKRAGEYVTLRDVINEVGKDASLFFFLMRRLDSPLEFDLELAKRQSTENPVYYVQYAHARLSSVFRQTEERNIQVHRPDQVNLDRLALPEELTLIRKLCQYPDVIEDAAEVLEPHRITFYLQELAALLHNYYYQHRIISEDDELTQARLQLMMAVRVVIRNALEILGVSAPERM